jgi:hypothetical protein
MVMDDQQSQPVWWRKKSIAEKGVSFSSARFPEENVHVCGAEFNLVQ